MEPTEIYNSDNHDSLQNQAPIRSKTDIYKPLFFTFFAFFLITASCLITIALTKDKTNTVSIPIETITISPVNPTSVPTISEKKKSNFLNISDIEIEFPEGWVVSSVSENTAKVLTDYQKYQVYLTLKVEKNTADAVTTYEYQKEDTKIKTQYGEFYDIASTEVSSSIGAFIKGNKYIFLWNIESNQPTPENLNHVWVPDNNITETMIYNITRTAKPTSPLL